MLTCHAVANYLIWLAHKDGRTITHLKLQKLVYYAQGFFLALYGEPLFPEPIFAWEHGSVVEQLWQSYKAFGKREIPCPSEINLSIYSPRESEVIEQVHFSLGHCHAWYLRNKNHKESPWLDAYPNDEISLGSMKTYFSSNLTLFNLDSLQTSSDLKVDLPTKAPEKIDPFEIYLKSKKKWGGVYRRLGNS